MSQEKVASGSGVPLPLLAGVPVLLAVTAQLILSGHPRLGGLTALPASAGIIGLCMIGRGQRSARLRFAGQLMDRAFDGCILAPLAWVSRVGAHRTAVLALVGLSVSFLASYERARGESLDYRGSEREEYQAVRMSLLALGLLAGLVEPALWTFLVLAGAAASVRAANVIRQQRRPTRAAHRVR